MAQTIIKWVCKNCGNNNLAVRSENIKCTVCGTPQDPSMTQEAVVGPFSYVRGYWEDLYPEDEGQWNIKRAEKVFSCARRGSEPGRYLLFDIFEKRTEISIKILRKFRFIEAEKTRQLLDPYVMEHFYQEYRRSELWPEDDEYLQLDNGRLSELQMEFWGAIQLAGLRGYYFRSPTGDYKFYTLWMCEALGLFVKKK